MSLETNVKKNILLIQPKSMVDYQNITFLFRKYLKIALAQPASLLSIAGFLPDNYNVRVIDENLYPIEEQDVLWADFVFLTGISLDKLQIKRVADYCRSLNKVTVLGGPHATVDYEEIDYVDCLVIGEAQKIMPQFLNDLAKNELKKIYRAEINPDLEKFPPPIQRFDLVNIKDYFMTVVQYSIGCPYNCDFCDTPILFKGKQRAKPISHFIKELDELYKSGYRGVVTICDENFTANKNIKTLLNELFHWQKAHDFPFIFSALGSVNFIRDSELTDLLLKAGVIYIFIGFETIFEDTLLASNKKHNLHIDYLKTIKDLHHMGFMVIGGFIVGFDNEPEDVFSKLAGFINESGITSVVLNSLVIGKGTKLYDRLISEGRHISDSDILACDNIVATGYLNFIPKIGLHKFSRGFAELAQDLFSPKKYFGRCNIFLKDYNFPYYYKKKLSFFGVGGSNMFKYIRLWFSKGVFSFKYNYHLLKFLMGALIRHPSSSKLSLALELGFAGILMDIKRKRIKWRFSKENLSRVLK